MQSGGGGIQQKKPSTRHVHSKYVQCWLESTVKTDI